MSEKCPLISDDPRSAAQQLELLGEAAPEPPKKRRAARPKGVKSQAPEQLSAEQLEQVRAWVAEKEPWALPRLAELVDACLRHFRASGKPMVNWALVAQNWVERERTHFGRGTEASPRAAKGSRPRYSESAWDSRPPYSDEDDES